MYPNLLSPANSKLLSSILVSLATFSWFIWKMILNSSHNMCTSLVKQCQHSSENSSNQKIFLVIWYLFPLMFHHTAEIGTLKQSPLVASTSPPNHLTLPWQRDVKVQTLWASQIGTKQEEQVCVTKSHIPPNISHHTTYIDVKYIVFTTQLTHTHTQMSQMSQVSSLTHPVLPQGFLNCDASLTTLDSILRGLNNCLRGMGEVDT